MKKKIHLVLIMTSFSIFFSSCGNTYTATGDMNFSNENIAGQTAIKAEVAPEVNVVNDKSQDQIVESSNNTTNNTEINNEQYEELKKQNNELQVEIDSLKEQLVNVPAINYRNLSLSIDGNDKTINRNNAMIIVDGKNYFSEDIIKKLIDENQNMVIEEETLYIGKIITNQQRLVDQWIVEDYNCKICESKTDSYGNTYADCLLLTNNEIVFNLNREFLFIKFNISMSEDIYSDTTGMVTIKADDNVVYSKELNKYTEPVLEIDIPINNCSLLKICYDSNHNFSSEGCIISDAILYN